MHPEMYNFKKITAVPRGDEIIDVVLMRTQRKTPTVIHPGYKISRIRKFYMRKVKFTEQTCTEKLGVILSEFPRLDVRPWGGGGGGSGLVAHGELAPRRTSTPSTRP